MRSAPIQYSTGAYYILMDISGFGYDSDLEFCETLAEKVGVGAVPGSSFFREPVNHLIRFHFAKKDETLLDALNRLESLRKKIPPMKRIKPEDKTPVYRSIERAQQQDAKKGATADKMPWLLFIDLDGMRSRPLQSR